MKIHCSWCGTSKEVESTDKIYVCQNGQTLCSESCLNEADLDGKWVTVKEFIQADDTIMK